MRMTKCPLSNEEWRASVGIRTIDVRRMVLGALLIAGTELSITDIVRDVDERVRITVPARTVSEVCRHQTSAGRVVRVARGVYRAVPAAFSASTMWRCRTWRPPLT